MMTVLVVSDTHGKYFALEEVLERQLKLVQKFRPSHLIHLGDGISDLDGSELAQRFCLHTVRGNCDDLFYAVANEVPKERLIEFYGYKILIMHGDSCQVKSGDAVAVERAVFYNADLLMFGHTHIATSYTLKKGTRVGDTALKKDISVFNPGSLGYSGSFGVLTLSDSGMLLSHGSLK